MTLNSLKTRLLTGAAAIAAVGAAAAGVTSIASGSLATSPAVEPPTVQLVVVGSPLPQQPVADLPSADQLHSVLNGLGNPDVPFRSKANLVEGGIGIVEGRTADRMVDSALQKGYFPLSFTVANIAPAGPGAATATVTASGPNLTPTTQTVTFVNDGAWKLSRESGMTLLQSALA